MGGTVGLAIQGAGAIIGLGTGIIKKGADLGKSLMKGFSNLFGGKKNEKGGEVKPKVNANSLLDLKVEDKNVRGTGAKNRGRQGGNFSGDQQMNERGEYASKNKNEVVKEESFSIPEGKKESFAAILSGDRDRIHQYLFEQRVASIPPGEGFSDFSGNPAYDSDVDKVLEGLKDNPKGIGIEINRGRVFLSKDKAVDGGYTFGRDTKYEGVKSDNEMYGDTFPKRSFSGSKKNTYERAILEFNEGGVVQKFNQGGEVDTVPAMLTPGEFVVSKDAVKKVGVDTLKGLNASVGATNKPTYTMGYRRGEITPDQLVVTSTKFIDQKTQKRMGGQGGRALGSTTKRQGGDTFESKNLFGENYAGISRRTTTSSLDYIPGGDGVRDSNLKTKKIMEEDIVSVAVEDIIEHQDDLLKRIRRVKGYENVTIEDVLNSRVDMDKQKYARIIGHSDAAKATQKKKDEARKLDKEKYGDGYYNYFDESFNQGGLVEGAKKMYSSEIEENKSKNNLKPLLDMIGSGESDNVGGYSAMFPSESYPKMLDMTINEVIEFQKEKLKDGRKSVAVGRYQMLYPEDYAAAAGLPLTAKFTPENQDKMVIAYLKKNRKLNEFIKGEITNEQFSEELSQEFGTFKSASGFVLPNNTGSIDFPMMVPVLNKIKNNLKPETKSSDNLQSVVESKSDQLAQNIFTPPTTQSNNLNLLPIPITQQPQPINGNVPISAPTVSPQVSTTPVTSTMSTVSFINMISNKQLSVG